VGTVGVGVDVVDVARFELALRRRPALAERLFTERERSDARGKPERLAARFAAKEAILKTLGVGLGALPWKSMEIRRAPSGAPSVMLHGPASELAARKGVDEMHVSMTHTALTAAAIVVGSSGESRDAG
jgi:holo-[acyl-carrier protein] synthase